MENLLKDTDQIQEKEKQNKPGFVDNFIQKIQRMVEGAMGGRQRTETEKEGDRYANQDLNAFKKIIKLLEVIRWLILDVVTIRRYKNFPSDN